MRNLNQQQFQKMKAHPGFIAALDQSGGSTPGALRQYGIQDGAWSNEDEMFALCAPNAHANHDVPQLQRRANSCAILFENTMDRDVEKRPTADYLWNVKRIVPFLKIDQGLTAENDGVQLMKPMPDLGALLVKANAKGVFGTKMRSVINQASAGGIKNIVKQQFEVARQIVDSGLVPIVEPEVDIHCPMKADAEGLLRSALCCELDRLRADQWVMLKLTLPAQDDFYAECINHPNVLRVVALSGGYSQADANDRLRRNHGIVASFSRALVEGLSAQQSDAEFNARLNESIAHIFEASTIKSEQPAPAMAIAKC